MGRRLVTSLGLRVKGFAANERGTTAIEYAFIAALVSMGIVGALSAMSGSLMDLFGSISSTLSGASSG